MSVPQYTTPVFTLVFNAENLDLTRATSVYVTFKHKNTVITKSGDSLTVEEKSITVKLTQEECGAFPQGFIEIQANWLSQDGDRSASEAVPYYIGKQLLKEVIS